MIGYNVNYDTFLDLIRVTYPDWIRRARALTARSRIAGHHPRTEVSHWSVIKPLLMRVQRYKCGYCERRLEGRIEFDVEHFRPKDTYYLLAYDLRNYLVACKPCNSCYKKTGFALFSERDRYPAAESSEAADRVESSVLVHPLWRSTDRRPEDLIGFAGIVPVPRYADGQEHERAKRIIATFDLAGREQLWRERAEVISQVWQQYTRLIGDDGEQHGVLAMHSLRRRTSVDATHTNCARSFLRVCVERPKRAERIYNDASAYLNRSGEPGVYGRA